MNESQIPDWIWEYWRYHEPRLIAAIKYAREAQHRAAAYTQHAQENMERLRHKNPNKLDGTNRRGLRTL